MVHLLAHGRGVQVVHEAGDGQLHEAEHLAVGHDDHAAAHLGERVGRQRHVRIVGAHHEQVVGVVGNGGGHGAALDAEALGEPDAEGAALMVALEDEGLQHVLFKVAFQGAVRHGEDGANLAVGHRAGQHLDDAHAYRVTLGGIGRRFHAERLGRDGAPQVHGVGHPGRVFEGRKREGARAVFGHDLAVDEHAGDVQILQVVQKHDVGALARGDGAQLVVHAEAGGGVDGHHLDGAHRVDAAFHGLAQDVVEVPIGHERVRVRVVGDEVREARVDVGLGDGGRQVRQVEPRRAVAQLGVLAEAHLGQRVLGAGRLVAAAHAAGDVGVQPLVGLGDGVVACDHLVGGEGGGQLAVGVIGARQHAGEVHHLAEAHHAVPGHGIRDLGGAHGGAGVLEAGHGRHAGRRRHHGLQRRARSVLHHHLHPFKAEHIAHLVGIPVNAHRAVGDNGPGVLAGADHGGLHVDVPV